MSDSDESVEARVGDWWRTAIFDFEPGKIWLHGYPVEQLIGGVGFGEMIWLMLRGELPDKSHAALLEAALVAAVDHGPQAPAIAIARMAVSCGNGINNAMGSAVNVLGDVHGGAGEQAMELYADVTARLDGGADMETACAAAMDAWVAGRDAFIPGFGHRFHPVDPRSPRLLALVDAAASRGAVSGRYAAIGRAVEAELARRKGRTVAMNIDGATGVVFAELGFPPTLGRGLFVLSRSVGVLAHAWEEIGQGSRNKGPIPPEIHHRYTGPAPRDLPGPDGGRGPFNSPSGGRFSSRPLRNGVLSQQCRGGSETRPLIGTGR